jgi:hypothetical protein
MTAPFTQSMSGLGRLVGMMRAASQHTGTLVNGGLAGMSAFQTTDKHTAGTTPGKSSDQSALANLTNLSAGLLSMAAHLDWACRENDRKKKSVTEAFQKLNAGRQSNQDSWLDLTNSLREIESLTALAKSFVNKTQTGTSTGATSSASTSTTSGSSSLPAPTAAAQRVFLRGGLTSTQITPVSIGALHG